MKKQNYAVELKMNFGGYEKYVLHVIPNACSPEEATEIAVRNEAHDREDDTPPDENGWYEDCNGEIMYQRYKVRTISQCEADVLNKYI